MDEGPINETNKKETSEMEDEGPSIDEIKRKLQKRKI